MPIRATLLAEIQTALTTAITPSLTTTSDPWDIYEAYVLSIVLRAAQAEGAQVSFFDVHGNIPTIFIFRTGPGHIYSTRRNYCHAMLTFPAFPNKPLLEVHMSVRVSGKSRVLHECDVSVLFHDEAETCRQAAPPKPDPRNTKVLIALECKFYDGALSLGLGRGFLGLDADLGVNDTFIVFNTPSPVVETFLTERDRERHWEHQVVPSNPNKVDRFRNRLQSAFQSYLSEN